MNTLIPLLFAEHRQQLVMFAYKYVRDWSTAEDVVQDVFLKILKRNPAEITKTFLCVSVRNKCFDLIKVNGNRCKRNRKYFYVKSAVEQPPVEKEAAGRVITFLLKQLTPTKKQICEMIYLQDKSYKEICAETGWNVSTVTNHHLQALQKLRGELQKQSIEVILR